MICLVFNRNITLCQLRMKQKVKVQNHRDPIKLLIHVKTNLRFKNVLKSLKTKTTLDQHDNHRFEVYLSYFTQIIHVFMK